MAEPLDAIDPEEIVLRRVHLQYYKPNAPVRIDRGAFKPTPSDVDGISLYRASRVSAQQVQGERGKPENYAVVRLSARAVLALGVRLSPAERPDDPLPGHMVIPELNCTEYLRDKTHLKELTRKLAEIANGEDVLPPATPPA